MAAKQRYASTDLFRILFHAGVRKSWYIYIATDSFLEHRFPCEMVIAFGRKPANLAHNTAQVAHIQLIYLLKVCKYNFREKNVPKLTTVGRLTSQISCFPGQLISITQ